MKDVSAQSFVEAYARHLKKKGKFQIPTWFDLVKTACVGFCLWRRVRGWGCCAAGEGGDVSPWRCVFFRRRESRWLRKTPTGFSSGLLRCFATCTSAPTAEWGDSERSFLARSRSTAFPATRRRRAGKSFVTSSSSLKPWALSSQTPRSGETPLSLCVSGDPLSFSRTLQTRCWLFFIFRGRRLTKLGQKELDVIARQCAAPVSA